MATKTIHWAQSLQAALDRAKREDKPLYVDFFFPT
jgi:hypothetical protein